MIEIVEVEHEKSQEDAFSTRLLGLLEDHATALGYPIGSRQIRLEARQDGAFAGGLTARIVYGWLDIRLLAVEPPRRSTGAGRALIEHAEGVARADGAIGINVDTMGYQAPGFYLGLGFEEVARLRADVPERDRIFYVKRLVADR